VEGKRRILPLQKTTLSLIPFPDAQKEKWRILLPEIDTRRPDANGLIPRMKTPVEEANQTDNLFSGAADRTRQ
jgi:hypothetical protein